MSELLMEVYETGAVLGNTKAKNKRLFSPRRRARRVLCERYGVTTGRGWKRLRRYLQHHRPGLLTRTAEQLTHAAHAR